MNSSNVQLLLAALLSSVSAQEAQFIFDDKSFASRVEDFDGRTSVFRLDDIKDGKTFTLSQNGGGATMIRLDLMDLRPNEESLILASWCPDNSCTSTAGFSCSFRIFSTNLNKFKIINR